MNRNLLVLFLFALTTGTCSAQGGFFWSSSDLNSGATQDANHVVNLAGQPIGTTGSLFLYYSTESSDIDTGASLDLSWTNHGVIAFTTA